MPRRQTDIQSAHTASWRSTASAALLMFVFGAAASYAVGWVDARRHASEERSKVVAELSTVRARLEGITRGTFSATSGLVDVIGYQGNISPDLFNSLARKAIKWHPQIRNIVAAPDNIIAMVYPLAGNERVMGLDYSTIPEQYHSIRTVMASGTPLLSGPFDLVQGGRGFVLRSPVFTRSGTPPDSPPRYWGVVSIVASVDAILSADTVREAATQLDIAMRGRDGKGAGGELFWGDAAVFAAQPVTMSIEIPGGTWQIAARPKGGWGSHRAVGSTLWFIGLLNSLILALFVALLAHRHRLLRLRNRELVDEISSRQRAEQALSASEERYRSLVDNIPLGITLIDRDRRILLVNKTISEWLDHPPEWFIGRFCYEEFEKRDQTCDHCPGTGSMATGLVATVDTTGIRDDGSRFDVRIRTVPQRDETDTITGYIEVIEDISELKTAEEERKRLEQQIRHSQKLESLGVLAGGIAHDFNNILTSIIGNADLALQRLKPESPARNNISRIESAAAQAADLARQMLAYSGKGKFVIEPVDFNIVIEELLSMLEVSISKKARLRLNLTRPLPAVEADAAQIRQVLMNLVINASEAIGEQNGVITVTTGTMSCPRSYLQDIWLSEEQPEGDYVYMEVSDNGCGMDRETIARIFDPFFTTKFTGRGLGMAAVLGIIRGHQGGIKVYSEPGSGTTFKVLLPASALTKCSSEDSSDHGEWHGSGTVLLVDDEETIRIIGAELLNFLGYDVVTAIDGRHAIEMYLAHPEITSVLLDLTMPRMDGEECFRELRGINPDVTVIMASGYNEQEVTEKFCGKGLAGFVQKPYTLSMLRQAFMKLDRNTAR